MNNTNILHIKNKTLLFLLATCICFSLLPFSVSGSDFVQLYVGVGASRVRELFKEAKKHEKAVSFIDEIDAIGKKRSQGAFQGNDEKDQTLNALLT